MKIIRIFIIAATFLIMVSISVNLYYFSGKEIPNTGIYIDLAAMAVLLLGLVITHFIDKKPKPENKLN